jgi:hypothetical protein
MAVVVVVAAVLVTVAHAQFFETINRWAASSTCDGTADNIVALSSSTCSALNCTAIGGPASQSITCPSSFSVPSGALYYVSAIGTDCSTTPTLYTASKSGVCIPSGSGGANSTVATCSGASAILKECIGSGCTTDCVTTTIPVPFCFAGVAAYCSAATSLHGASTAVGLLVGLVAVLASALFV